MNFLLVTIGSHGDVHPFVGIGAALKARGHDVTLMTNGHFGPLVRREAIDFVSFGDPEYYRRMMENRDLWSKRNGFRVIFASIAETLKKVYEPIVAHVRAHPNTVVISSSLCLAARVAQDKIGFRMITVHLSPAIFRSSHSPPRLPGLYMPGWMPLSLKDALWALGDRLIVDPVIAPALNAFRADVGLVPVKRVLWEWWNSPDCVLGMFPDWFANKQPDWPAQTRLAHFPMYDERGHEPLSSELEQFLSIGDAPIAFTPGSAMIHGQKFFATAAEACRRIGRRGLLLTRHPEQLPAALSAGVIHVPYAPFSDLLPRCAALVHHGGIGTTSQALRAGVPQLVMPMTHDQPDNAMRLARLGVADEIAEWRFNPAPVAKKLRRLIGDPSVASACRAVARRFAGPTGIDIACDLAESFAHAPATRNNPAPETKSSVGGRRRWDG